MKRSDWWYREQNKFVEGEYSCPPWKGCITCIKSDPGVTFDPLPDVENHLAHICIKNPLHIAYTKNEDHGIRDIQTAMKPGRYLQTNYPHLKPEQVAFYASLLALANDNGPGKLKFASTEDEIEHVYTNGPSSCMSHKPGHGNFLTSGFHPVRVYAAGDLQVAYVLGKNKKVAARVLCWPEKKVYGRIYGDGGAFSATLEKMLKELGYKNGRMYGARIQKKQIKEVLRDYPFSYVAPFVDNCERLRIEGDYIVLSAEGNLPANTTNGLVTIPTRRCVACRSQFPDELKYGKDTLRNTLCDTCVRTEIVMCPSHKEEILKSKLLTIRLKNGENKEVCGDCVGNKFSRCGHCNFYVEKETLREDVDGGKVCDICANDKKVYEGDCKRCSHLVPAGTQDKRRSDLYCRECSYIITCEKKYKDSNIPIDKEILKMTAEHDIDYAEYMISLQAVREAVAMHKTVSA